MKRFAVLLLSLCLAAIPCLALVAMHGHASVFTAQTPSNYACFPINENGEGAAIPFTCTGFGTVMQANTTFNSLTVILGRPVEGSHQIAIQPEDFTTGNNVGNACLISTGQAACSVNFTGSNTVSSGDIVGMRIWDNITGPDAYNIERADWVLQ